MIPAPRTSNATEACLTARQYFAASSSSDITIFLTVNETIFILQVIFCVVSCMAWLLVESRTSYLGKARSGPANIVWCVGVVLMFLGMAWRLALIDPQTGVTTMPCLTSALCITWSFFFLASAYFMRAFVILSKAEYSKMVQVFSLQLESDDAQITTIAARSPLLTKHKKTIGAAEDALEEDNGYDDEITLPSVLNSVARFMRLVFGFKSMDKQALNITFAHVKAFGEVKVMLSVGVLLAAPGAMIGTIVIVASSPIYQSEACAGCDITVDVAGVVIGTAFFYCLLAFRVLYLCRTLVNESFGVIREFLSIPFVCGGPIVIGGLLLVFDPGHVDARRIFSWEWIILFGIFASWFVMIPLQLLLGMRGYVKKKFSGSWFLFAKAVLLRADVEQAGSPRARERKASVVIVPSRRQVPLLMETLKMNPPELKQNFETFLASRFCVESLRFLDDCASYERFVREKDDRWQISKSKLLFNTYVSESAALQVNVSEGVRTRCEAMIRKGQYMDAFTEAKHEVEDLMQFDVWYDFVMNGGLRGFKVPEVVGAPQQTMLSAVSGEAA